ncbi:MAG: YicC family protein [Acidobacteria bacterium]|nr:YicC family protein [Candidatus Sulfomarinibacter kjeldsenii]
MALMSMTGFGRARAELSDRFGVSVVVRSVNHRYLDIQVRTNLREDTPEIEAAVRSVISKKFHRGRVTAQVNLERILTAEVDVAVNADAVSEVLAQLSKVAVPEKFGGAVELGDVLAVPGLVSVASPETILEEEEVSGLRSVASEAVAEAEVMRREEGARLVLQIESEVAEVIGFADWFEPQMPEFRQRLLDRVKDRVEALVGPEGKLDPERVLQEAAVLADRADVAEEVVRLRAHLENFSERLAAGGVVGRSLDFLCQEIHRELNTLGSKCRELGVADRLVDAKSAAERVREQVQNLE